MQKNGGDKKFIFIICLLCIIPILGVLFFIKTFLPIQLSSQTPKGSVKPTPVAFSGMPIASSDSHIRSLSMFYVLQGNVISVTEKNISLDKNLPSFPIKSTVKVLKSSPSSMKGVAAKYSDIKIGSHVILYTIYDAAAQSWYVSQISLE